MDRGSPWPIPFDNGIGSDMKLLNLSRVFLLVRSCSTNLVMVVGILCFLKLCMSRSVTAFGKAPSTSR